MSVSFVSRLRRGARLWRAAPGLSVAAILLVLGGCASAPNPSDPVAVREFKQINDPLEPLNRAIFTVNRGVDTMFLRPAATIYGGVFPAPVKVGVHNFLSNLRLPIVFINDVLQGEGVRARQTLGRFLINSTFGVLGLGDPATGVGLAYHGEDFGQTLAKWGVSDGPYLMLPLFGPSNPRDTTGLVVDFLADPFSRWAANTDEGWTTWARRGTDAVDTRARNAKEIDSLERTSLDYYAAIRSLYRQHRRDQINNGAHPTPMTSPDFGSMSAAPPMSSPSASSVPHPVDFGQTVQAAAQTR
ncbi:MlaA family lipoprotein [Varunaivibrio sulfuroxidans]|uniref:Phospholipid-binding lipoprotein MlaA n=1 Tax=Varunaivibrio sulfuroxidans TaxID=1773489 RepID=A0A4R3JGB5_9PROT|nr:VacJ family lipoprotein [Varunaivibrio sulfuroxidans]TCS64942.1 phospholipid-binding lipoprotein MlaA [Varunaivibrio sulfuroxidans]WES29766.1 VacJ family lipoprotein [Varunaivibrio sulfuroxidans]